MKKRALPLILPLIFTLIFSACASSGSDDENAADMSAFEPPSDFEWDGSYIDETSGLVMMDIMKDGRKYRCTINVPDAGITHISSYTFTAKKGDLGLSYEDGTYGTYDLPDFEKNPDAEVSYDEVYTDGSGSIYYLNDRLYWIDDKNDAGAGMAFKRIDYDSDEE